LQNGTATAKAAPVKGGLPAAQRRGLALLLRKNREGKPEEPITPAEAWAMVDDLKINIEYSLKTKRWIATFRNDEKYIYLPVDGATAFESVVELLAQIGVEVAHG
jgi:hypothetical protein